MEKKPLFLLFQTMVRAVRNLERTQNLNIVKPAKDESKARLHKKLLHKLNKHESTS